MTNTPINPVYVVDWEADEENPPIYRISIDDISNADNLPKSIAYNTELHDTGTKTVEDFLRNLMSDCIDGMGYNMEYHDTREEAEASVKAYKADNEVSEEDENAARLNALKGMN